MSIGGLFIAIKRYDEDFKKSIASLYENGRSINSLAREYGVSVSSVAKWTKLYTSASTEDGEVLTAKQIKELQKRNAILEEENLILKKAIAIFTPPLFLIFSIRKDDRCFTFYRPVSLIFSFI